MTHCAKKLAFAAIGAAGLLSSLLIGPHGHAPDGSRSAGEGESSAPRRASAVLPQAPLPEPSGVRAVPAGKPSASPEQRIADLLRQPLDLSDPAAAAELRRLEDLARVSTIERARALNLPLVTEHGAVLSGFEGDRPRYDIQHNQEAAITTVTDLVRETAPFNLDGANGQIGLWDVGEGPSVTHLDIKDGVDIKDNAPPIGLHASHLAGTMIGQGFADPAARGMAPGAELWCYTSENVLSELASAAATGPGDDSKLYISVHPYGEAAGWEFGGTTWFGVFSDDLNEDNDYVPAFGQYNSTAAAWDGFAWNTPYHLMIKSAGNHGDDDPPLLGSVWSHNGSATDLYIYGDSHPRSDDKWLSDKLGFLDPRASAKNVLTIGSVSDAIFEGSRNLAYAGTSAFTSMGPTDDGRIKPDLVTNGESLLSVDGATTDQSTAKSGTSMAAAGAAGSAQLLVQQYGQLFPGDAMLASSLKALLIHTADDIEKEGPDYESGWGLMNVHRAATLLQDHAVDNNWGHLVEDNVRPGRRFDEYTIISDGIEPIRVTLAWTDPAGAATSGHDQRAPRLVHDLNLLVTSEGGVECYPYVMPFVGVWDDKTLGDKAVTGVNTVDNVEQVLWVFPPAGEMTIRVDYAGELQGRQDYSLCVSGARVHRKPNVQVRKPVDDLFFVENGGAPIDDVADVGKVFTNAAVSYDISVAPAGILSAEIDPDEWVDLTPVPGALGTATVTLTAYDIHGNSVVDEFAVTLMRKVIKVNAATPAPAPAQNGVAWPTAFASLQDALAIARPGQEIWVAAGVYHPDEVGFVDTNDRARAFRVPVGVSLYGGFDGSESARDDRMPALNQTILSGDLDQNDYIRPIATYVGNAQGNTGNNSYRVVDLSACADTDVFDGFVVTAGNASGGGWDATGAGIDCGNADLTVSNCLISGNNALSDGGGVLVVGGSPRIVNCILVGNLANNSGGGLWTSLGNPSLVSCEFRGNLAGVGGGLTVSGGSAEISNCLVSGNRGILGGAGIEIFSGRIDLTNSTLSANRANSLGAALRISGGPLPSVIANCILWDNMAGNSMTVGASVSFYQQADSPLVSGTLMASSGGSGNWNPSCGTDAGGNTDVNPKFSAGIQPPPNASDGGDFSLIPDSPAIDAADSLVLPADSVDLDSDGDYLEPLPLDLIGNVRLASANVDQGAYEFTSGLYFDSDADGLSDEFELLHGGDTTGMDAAGDLDGDGLSALAEFIHGEDPNAPLRKPIGTISSTGVSGKRYLSITYRVDPVALNFATYAVLHRWHLNSPEGWREDQTAQVSSRVSPTNPNLLEIVERSLLPMGTDSMEFLRIRHQAAGGPVGPGGTSGQTNGGGLFHY